MKNRIASLLVGVVLGGSLAGSVLPSFAARGSSPGLERRVANLERDLAKVDERTKSYSPIQFTCPGRPGPTPGSVEFRDFEVVEFGFYCKPFGN